MRAETGRKPDRTRRCYPPRVPTAPSSRRRLEPNGEAIAHRRPTRPATTDPAADEPPGSSRCADPSTGRRDARGRGPGCRARGGDPGRGEGCRGRPPPKQRGSSWSRPGRGGDLLVLIAGDARSRGVCLTHTIWACAVPPRPRRSGCGPACAPGRAFATRTQSTLTPRIGREFASRERDRVEIDRHPARRE